MIPAGSITATLEADLSYNPSVHVQTVEIDRTGANMLTMATDNFVKWYITLKDFQNLCWNVRDLSAIGMGAANYPRDVSDVDQSNNIYAFVRTGDFYRSNRYDSNPYSVPNFDYVDASYAEEGGGNRQDLSGILLQQEASGGTVKFAPTHLSFFVPLADASESAGNSSTSGTDALVGNTQVTYDRVMLNEDASSSIQLSTNNNLRTEAGSTVTTWNFVDSSFAMTVNWIGSGRTGTTDFSDASVSSSTFDVSTNWLYDGNQYWGNNVIHIHASAGSSIRVNKPYNDAAADFIQIGMDASGLDTDFSSGTGFYTSGNVNGRGLGATSYGVSPGNVSLAGSGLTGADVFSAVDPLLDPLGGSSNRHTFSGMNNAVADDVNDNIDFGAYLSDYTTTHVDQTRNLIRVQIGKPTIKISEHEFTKAIQQAIDHDMSDVIAVRDTLSLRYAIRDAFHANHLRGFQCGAPDDTATGKDVYTASKVTLDLPLTIAGQTRYTDGSVGTSTGMDISGDDNSTSNGSTHKRVYLTPIIELVPDDYYHPAWYSYSSDS